MCVALGYIYIMCQVISLVKYANKILNLGLMSGIAFLINLIPYHYNFKY